MTRGCTCAECIVLGAQARFTREQEDREVDRMMTCVELRCLGENFYAVALAARLRSNAYLIGLQDGYDQGWQDGFNDATLYKRKVS